MDAKGRLSAEDVAAEREAHRACASELGRQGYGDCYAGRPPALPHWIDSREYARGYRAARRVKQLANVGAQCALHANN